MKPKNHFYITFLLLFSFLGYIKAQAQVIDFIGFASLEAGNPSNCIQITANSANQQGWVYAANRFNLTQNRTINLTVFVGSNNNGADGVVFVLHNDPRGYNAVGCKGQALGYAGSAGFMVNCNAPNGATGSGITPSVGVEIDIFRNQDWSEPTDDHVAFLQNGNANHVGAGADLSMLSNGYLFSYNIENNLLHPFKVEWIAATQMLIVHFDGIKVLERNIPNLITELGTSEPLWGFTGSTGGTATQQYFCNAGGVTLSQPLPISLLSFEAQQINQKVQIDWTTISEQDNDYFTIERSVDGQNFTPIGIKPGAGNSIELIEYRAFDEQPRQGLNYYRLKQTDYDGTSTYSLIVPVNFSSNHTNSNFYPNPVQKNTLVYYQGTLGEDAEVEFWDIAGHQVLKSTIMQSINNPSFKVPDLNTGIYLVKIKKATFTEIYRLVVY